MRTLVLLAAIAASTLLLVAQNPGTTGSVTGRVMDADTLAPLAGVQVGSREVGYVVTDQEGRYRLQGLKPGRLSFSIPHNYMADPWPSKVVTVLAGQEISGVDFRYRLEAQISGRVLDENGNPVSGVRVIAMTREFEPNGDLRYQMHAAAITDDRGAYAITTAVRAGRAFWLLAHQLRHYTRPISEAPADASSRNRVFAATFYPSAESPSTATPIVPRSLEKRTADIRILKKPAYCLEATLMAGNAPAQMTFVLSEEERYAAEFPGVPNRQEGGSSGADGKIRLCDLPPGRYTVAAFPSSFSGLRAPEHFGTVSITIVDRDIKNITIHTLPLATVSGEMAWDSAPSDPALLQSVLRIRLDPALVGVASTSVSIPSQFTFPAIPGLRYSVSVFNPPSPLYVKNVTVGTTSILGKPYVPGTEKLLLTIGHDGGVINSRVIGTDSRPAIHSVVIVFPANVQSDVELATTMVEGLTDDNGVFVTRTLQPGRYIVLATDDPPPYVTSGAYGQIIYRSPEGLARILRARARGQSVELGPRATLQVNLTARPLEP